MEGGNERFHSFAAADGRRPKVLKEGEFSLKHDSKLIPFLAAPFEPGTRHLA
jgi:hypothetical protein